MAERLAVEGATVLMHGRDQERLAAAEADIEMLAGADRVRTYQADFASLAEVQDMADQIVRDEPELHALINNAGIGYGSGEREESADGHELRFAVNYLSGFLLTQELLALLRDSSPARIVNVASIGQAPIDFDDPQIEQGLRRHAGLRPVQARPDHLGHGAGRAAGRRRRHREQPAPVHLHAHQDRGRDRPGVDRHAGVRGGGHGHGWSPRPTWTA